MVLSNAYLIERISLRGICRAVGVTLKWLLGFLVQCFETLPDDLGCPTCLLPSTMS